jgi:hypothetical protein
MKTFDPTTTKKPNYIEAFDMIGALPPEVKQPVRHLMLRIWRHTNSDPREPRYGKAWMGHERLAREMGCTNVNDLFNQAEAFGIVGREHLFKKSDGKIVVSDKPYRKGTSKGMGEYAGSRYWNNWEKVKELTEKGVADSATPPETEPPTNDGMAKTATPNGVADSATPKESTTSKEIGVANSATPVAENATKGLKYSTPLLPPEVTETASVLPAKPSREPIRNQNIDDDAAKPKICGHKNETAEDRSETIIAAAHQRHLDRKTPTIEIKHRIQTIFYRVAHEASLPGSQRTRKVNLEWRSELKTNSKHWTALVDLYRTVGGNVVAAKWEEFLVNDDLKVTEPVDEQEEDGKLTGRRITDTVQRTYLLHRFLEKYDYVLRQAAAKAASSAPDVDSVVEVELAGACGVNVEEKK